MSIWLRSGVLLVLLGSAGSARPVTETVRAADPQASEALLGHWKALKGREWKSAYAGIHPDLKAGGFTLKKFTDLHIKRCGLQGLSPDIQIVGSRQAGVDIVVSFDLLVVPPGESDHVPVPPRRTATLRKSGRAWALMTHDLLATGL
jgi:hypothetical protein